jgi:hypothetical protein
LFNETPSSNNVDVIVFTVHPRGYQKQCSDDPMGTYVAPVPYFMNGWLQEIVMEMSDQGYDYQVPSAAQFIGCTPYQFNGQQYYFQLGCADGTTQALAVNIYSDNTCTTRSLVDGYDDSNIDVSALQVRSCQCVCAGRPTCCIGIAFVVQTNSPAGFVSHTLALDWLCFITRRSLSTSARRA